MEKSCLVVENLNVRLGGKLVLQNISFTVEQGECLAITGHTGAGKTTLVKALAGQLFSTGMISFKDNQGKAPKITVITRQHQFTNLSNLSSFYYQQRFNSFDAEDAQTANSVLHTTGATETEIQNILDRFSISHIRYAPLIQLSNGEHKRFQIAKAILQSADWLLLDSPYIGLDVQSRQMLNECLQSLVQSGIQILLITGPSNIPPVISHVAVLEDGTLAQKLHAEEYSSTHRTIPPYSIDSAKLSTIERPYIYPHFSNAVKMVNTTIIYNNKKILDNINWEVRKGDCWNLSGHNGSGKSTLISLINGDNPQAFANEIYLFDKRKGTGESIWNIKKMTGFISPELHHYFDVTINCFDLVASGLFDTIGLFKKLSEKQKHIISQWMSIMDISRFSARLFSTLSDGEQRKVLLTRALVKDPPLLLLDEPCQGLDEIATLQFTSLINDICTQLNKTLIYVSHYDAEIPACITKRITLNKGKMSLSVPVMP